MIALVVLLLLVLALHLAVLMKKDHWVIIILLFLVNRFFFLIPSEDTKIENAGTVADVGLLLGILYPLAVRRYRRRLVRLWTSPIAKIILSLVAMVGLTAVITLFRHGGTIMLALRVGRDYLYYLLFFPFAVILLDENKATRFQRLMTFVMVLVSVAYLAQTFLPLNTIYHHTFFEARSLGDIPINRIYISYFEFYGGMMLLVTFFVFILDSRHRMSHALLCLLFFLHVMFTQHRNLWATLIIGVTFSLFLLRKTSFVSMKKPALKLALSLAGAYILSSSTGLLEYVADRVIQGLADTPLVGGTLTGRLLESEAYLRMLADNIVTGVGLVHPQTGAFSTDNEYAYFSELGSIGLLFHFGVAGIVWLLTLCVIYRRRVRSLLRVNGITTKEQAIALGSYGYMFGALVMSALNGAFTTPAGITLLVLAMAHTESFIYRIENRVPIAS